MASFKGLKLNTQPRNQANVQANTAQLNIPASENAAPVPFAALPPPQYTNPLLTHAAPRGMSLLAPARSAPVTTKKAREQLLMASMQQQNALPHLNITKSMISLYSFEEMEKIAGGINITNKQLKDNGSVNDPRLGVVSISSECARCGQIDCPGHYGLIKFPEPGIYNPAFIREVVQVLTCVCNDCGNLLITEDIIEREGYNRLSYDKYLSALETYCKSINKCLAPKKNLPGARVLPCKTNPSFVTTDLRDKGVITYKVPSSGNKPSKADPIHTMHITTVINILKRIDSHAAKLLGFPYHASREDLPLLVADHPRNMIMRGILVTPIVSRPPVSDGGSIHHDQLTHMYATIMAKTLEAERNPSAVIDLYTAVKQLYYDSDGKKMGMRDFQSIIMRLQGKEGLPRKFLMGKRNNYCGRTVSGPGPTLKFGEVGIPAIWASTLTKKVKVTNFNLAFLTKLLEEDKITHIIPKHTGLRHLYDKRYWKQKLRIGDTVERFLQDGDRMVVNRQPTLHRQSIMGYNVKLTNNLTINLHLSYTTPMNNDFDGDENNAWNPQDFEVEAEVDGLLQVKQNIMSSEKNLPSMGLVMNSVTSAYLISNPAVRIDDDFFAELLDLITDKSVFSTLAARLIKYGVNPRSGQAIVSAMLPVDFYYQIKGVTIMEGILISGRLKKSHVGTSHRSIIQELFKKYGAERTATFFTDAPWVLNKWLIEYGFSVGLSDMVSLATETVTDQVGNTTIVEYDKNKRTLKRELAQINVGLEALGPKLADPMEELFRQRTLVNLLNSVEGVGTRLADAMLSSNNSIGVMTEKGGGAKGSVANIVQMVGAVGQQNYRGKRLQPSISGGTRLLPTYDENDNNPEANAFISESFFTGVGPEGLFFLQAGGREGILDTSLKTAETGAMQHRMMKAFENIIIGYDGSVRNIFGTMFSPMYNSGYDIGHMVAVDTPGQTNFSSFTDLKSLMMEMNNKRGWVKKETSQIIGKPAVSAVDNVLSTYPTQAYNGPYIDNRSYDLKAEVPETVSTIKITRFEKTRIIGTRAMQLSNNAPPLIQLGDMVDTIDIATKEYEAGVIPMYIIRKFSDGSYQTVAPTKENI